MTFNFAPWAIDGARGPASLARLAAYASAGGRSGIIRPTDLRVSAAAVPGQELRISSGGAIVLNRYLTNPDEAYVVSNPSTHSVLAASMPPATAGTSYYLVCVVVGDPEFNQAGHPFMPSGPLSAEDALDYEYVRIVILPCTSSATTFEELGHDYPGFALARLEVPANTTTITNAMITDLRVLAKPRTESQLLLGRNSADPHWVGPLTGSAFINWADFRPTITIPAWATRMQIITHVTSIGGSADSVGEFRTVTSANGAGPVETLDLDVAERTTMMTTFDQDVAAIAGDSVDLQVQGRYLGGTGLIVADERTQVAFDVRFSETPI